MKPRGRPKKDTSQVTQCQTETQNTTQQLIGNFVERIENMEDEKIIAQKIIVDIYAEAKEQGIATAILREAIRLRKLKPHEREAYEATRNQYMQTIGLKP